jgi:hypothetical protein
MLVYMPSKDSDSSTAISVARQYYSSILLLGGRKSIEAEETAEETAEEAEEEEEEEGKRKKERRWDEDHVILDSLLVARFDSAMLKSMNKRPNQMSS